MSLEEGSRAKDPPPYASTRLIAYIGNKRALLPYLLSAFAELDIEAPIESFLDPFAGSGSVARLARSMGYRVMANDAEEYSQAVNACWLGISSEEAPSLFAEGGGIQAELSRVNRFHPERGDQSPPGLAVEPYIARHYAPADTLAADWRRERLFYTHENALFLDRARSYIEATYPAGSSGRPASERALLLGCLIYEAATHANTSGVFKACHKGFGGHGKDALKRIMAPMEVEPPLLWPGSPAEVARGDAALFCKPRSADLCYLDPPYNQHQYGSNYHLLNTIARWDRASVSEERGPDGSLVHKAGIPETWKETKSAFCSRSQAAGAFRELFASIDARFIVLSYNSEAFVSPEDLYDLLAESSEVELRSIDYVKYRGGRQSAERRVHNREMLFMARRREGRGSRSSAATGDSALRDAQSRGAELSALESDLRLARALSSALDPERLAGMADGRGRLVFAAGGRELCLPTYRLLLFEKDAAPMCVGLSSEEKGALASLIESAALEGNRGACEACIALLESGCSERRLQKLALNRLRKIAHRKYAADFGSCAQRMEMAAERWKVDKLGAEVRALRELFYARVEGRTH